MMISSFFDDVNSLDCYTDYLSIFRWWSHHFNPLSYCDVTPPPPPLRRTPRLLLLTSGIYAKYHVQIMLLFVYTTTPKRFVIFTCRYFRLSWNTTALSQSTCRNFSCSSLTREMCLFRKSNSAKEKINTDKEIR